MDCGGPARNAGGGTRGVYSATGQVLRPNKYKYYCLDMQNCGCRFMQYRDPPYEPERSDFNLYGEAEAEGPTDAEMKNIAVFLRSKWNLCGPATVAEEAKQAEVAGSLQDARSYDATKWRFDSEGAGIAYPNKVTRAPLCFMHCTFPHHCIDACAYAVGRKCSSL